ncbi:hypothetical protein MPRS_08030 [Mycobacterium paraseoulense]|nr:hypothetical protein MPRS_08030 [Mycobacterium paraseoulense]
MLFRNTIFAATGCCAANAAARARSPWISAVAWYPGGRFNAPPDIALYAEKAKGMATLRAKAGSKPVEDRAAGPMGAAFAFTGEIHGAIIAEPLSKAVFARKSRRAIVLERESLIDFLSRFAMKRVRDKSPLS